MDVIILAGGKGTRLRGVVQDRPKPLADVAGRPFLYWILDELQAQGLRRIILATGYKGEMVETVLGDGAALGLDIIYAREDLPLGTGGALRHALDYVTSKRVLVANGDSFCRLDLDHLLSVHHAQATLWAVPMDDCRRYGTIELEASGRIARFREKVAVCRPGLVNAGIYVFEYDVLRAIPGGRPVSLETEIFPRLVGHGLYAAVGQGPFLDIGTPESYRDAALFFGGAPVRRDVAS